MHEVETVARTQTISSKVVGTHEFTSFVVNT